MQQIAKDAAPNPVDAFEDSDYPNRVAAAFTFGELAQHGQ
jgi:hypothetical protein